MLSIRAISAVLCLHYIHSSCAHVLPVIEWTPPILTPLEYVLHNLAEQPQIIAADEYYDGSGDTIIYEEIFLDIFESSGDDSGDDEDNSTDTPAPDTTNAPTTDIDLTIDTTVLNILPTDESTTTHPIQAETNAENVVRLMDNLELI